MEFTKLESKLLRDFDKDEKWLQDIISKNPEILGLGDVIVRDKERRQASAGRLDLLLETDDGDKRYEVEIQLGSTDASHIIRTIEYWDRERKRYPGYDHCAVIVAEDITSRFFNVIGLFNGHIPIIALQFSAIQQPGNKLGLHFVRVLDEMTLGTDDTDDLAPPADKKYWTDKVGDKNVRFVEHICKVFGGSPYYTKSYAGIELSNERTAKANIKPKKKGVELRFSMPKSAQADALSGEYKDKRYRCHFADEKAFNADAANMRTMFRLATGQTEDGGGDSLE